MRDNFFSLYPLEAFSLRQVISRGRTLVIFPVGEFVGGGTEALFTLYWPGFSPARKPCLIRLSLLLRRFVFRMAEASAKRVTGDEPQGTMGRVQTTGEAPSRPLSPSRLPLRARFKERRLGTRQ